MKHKILFVLCVCIVVLFALTACSALAPAPIATPEPTATSIPPTATPTETPTPTPLPDPKTAILDGWVRTVRADSWRFEMKITAPGLLGDTLMTMNSERSGFNSHLKTVTTFLTTANIEETMTVNGQRYVRGPNVTYGLKDAKWYRLPSETNATNGAATSATTTTADPFAILVSNLESAVRLRSETLDGLNCDLYARDKRATFDAVMTFSKASPSVQEEEWSRVEVAESKYWICHDGYFHRLEINIIEQNKLDPTKKDFATIAFYFTDIGTDIVIEAPSDAQDLPTPTPFVTRTPLPTRTPTPTVTPKPQVTPQAGTNGQAARTESLKWRVVFSDTFDSNANDWAVEGGTTKYGTTVGTLANGKYRWSANALSGVIHSEVTNKAPFVADVAVSVSARRVSGPLDLDYGLIVRHNLNPRSYYAFGIKDSGYVWVDLFSNGNWTSMLKITKTTALRPGEANRLTVIIIGTHLTFFINDKYVGEFEDNSITTGRAGIMFGLSGGEDGEFEFDDFEMRAP